MASAQIRRRQLRVASTIAAQPATKIQVDCRQKRRTASERPDSSAGGPKAIQAPGRPAVASTTKAPERGTGAKAERQESPGERVGTIARLSG